MLALLVSSALMVDPSAFYTPYQSPHAAATVGDFYTPYVAPKVQKEKEKQKEKEEEWDPRKVVVYLDMGDVKTLKKISEDLDKRHELEYSLRSKDKVPAGAENKALPLVHFALSDDKFGYRSGWTSVHDFERYFFKLHPEMQRDQAPPMRASAPATSAPASRGYRAHSYEWHLVRGENAHSLRIHLATQQPEHQSGAAFPMDWLNTLSFHELVGLHSDAHNKRIQWNQVPAASKSMTKKEQKELGRVFYGTRDGKHPGPAGSRIRGFFGDPRYQNACPAGKCPWSR